jgi:hypothetical protein
VSAPAVSRAPELAVYHPWPQASRQRPIGEWMKVMLLFFDGIAILAPSGAQTRWAYADRSVIEPLTDRGLFRLIDPRELMDDDAAERILSYLNQASAYYYRHAGDGYRESQELPRDGLLSWGVVYPARGVVAPDHLAPHIQEYANAVWGELFARGLAVRATADNPLLLHPRIWGTLEFLLVYTLRPAGLRLGLNLQPATDDAASLATGMSLLEKAVRPLQSQIISSDLEQVALDLSRVPLDEILEFRKQHGAQYRQYAEKLRLLVTELGPLSHDERGCLLADHYLEIADAAEDLRRTARTWWRRPIATIGLGIAGAAWSGASGDVPSAVLSLLGGIVGSVGSAPPIQGSYSYLFEAQRSLMR